MKRIPIIVLLVVLHIQSSPAQQKAGADTVLPDGQLQSCVRYALSHQPLVRQSSIDESIAERAISIKLADWYPQVNFGFNFEHFPQLPVSIVQGSPVKLGVQNTSAGQFSLSQTIFNRDVLLASSSANDVRRLSAERTVSTKIDVVVNVSKAYYAVLVTKEQIDLLVEDIHRLQQSLDDAYAQYKSGVVDKTDFQRATIALNNATAQEVQYEELLKARYASLKDAMGFPPEAPLRVVYDTASMEREATFDTTQTPNVANRIEYQLLRTQRSLLETNVDYYAWGFLPSLTLFGGYNLAYQSNVFSDL
ncbi:MAG TPA: TolC family protein, partial [Terriglobia bacterium]|nr:TolC family protein [Terriglobia bacterium]